MPTVGGTALHTGDSENAERDEKQNKCEVKTSHLTHPSSTCLSQGEELLYKLLNEFGGTGLAFGGLNFLFINNCIKCLWSRSAARKGSRASSLACCTLSTIGLVLNPRLLLLQRSPCFACHWYSVAMCLTCCCHVLS